MTGKQHNKPSIWPSSPGSALTEAILDGKVEREDIFVTSKLWGSDHHDPVSGLKQTLKNMGMEHLDMYLVHWPVKLKPWACNPIPNEDEFEDLDLRPPGLAWRSAWTWGCVDALV
ncbi:aldo-keto reductase family 4 member C9 [Prunus yedoensis var. nudiflora]|uniref:Aldo-keto reductase family 4 member C9 n=1 Tax=Prunus yedoensis var. nudiflora TaxID=2094558 RepID=A0A314YD39_PRUYE|nr:aldo-keto reductase family 4 member C9 [Prunus yedoensis var. nudiflora]